MPDLTKSSKKLFREVYTYTFDENSHIISSIGGNATVINGIYKFYDINMKEVGYIMTTSNARTLPVVNTYSNRQCGIFFNNNDQICISYTEITNEGKSPAGTEMSAKATYSTGKYKNKHVNVNIKFLKDSKRKFIITYKE